ncbi:hypothetical protein [Pseudoduganella umbonata]|uniref:Starvation-inducible outer membrane lipoprotein n=1 Tax=Pseudoduganella umbonata TaxID=864828 RepID=A0A7W5HBK0_9BURK|nr:hypothetical protein [Pseudoduganella umbonata]MBB3221067.1 starvation-inducible outer membrane lipoprotein [Pseudoduganella umbonata]
MSKTIFFIAIALGLAGCRYLPEDSSRDCDKHMDWNDRKACKAKLSTEQKEWEKREAK